MKKTYIEKTNETKSRFLEKFSKIDKPLAREIKKKRKLGNIRMKEETSQRIHQRLKDNKGL